ncbi:MAG: NAD-dependent epimerase/dehydratase family protein [Candidatus Omnitrophica bacterium]|nr:NAD-dependent epimerase/dehydratase family protein [Candidatus Omnitrophota bacterium]
MRAALVTGGAGFIGSHLSERLLREGWKVYVVDNLSTGFKENIPAGAEFVFLDLSKDDFAQSLPRIRFDAVFHLAAQSSGEISFDDPVYDLKTNCLSTLILLDWCVKHGIKRFLYTSSMSIYGDQEQQPVREDAPFAAKSFYGAGKLASESYVNIYSKMGIDTTSLRLFNVYGPGQNMQNLRQGMVSIFMAYILKKEEILVKGSPDRYRDFVYIDDVVEAYMKCLTNTRTFGKTYNVASGERNYVRDLIELELKAFGYDSAAYPVRYSGTTPGDTFGIFADTAAIQMDTGWSPRFSLAEGLKRMSEWAISAKQISTAPRRHK